ncbi:MAG: hypothetical protein NXH75_09485 [Halobacteriovoraceae bacterium]|nr:hypothetical protein [Halobacteriovoraceae bacterium]
MVNPKKVFVAIAMLSLFPLHAEDMLGKTEDNSMQKSIGTGVGRVLEVFFNSQGLKSAVYHSGLRGNSATHVEKVVSLALENLAGKKNPSQREVLAALRSVSGNEDQAVKQKLFTIFRKSEKDMTKADFVEAVNSLVYLAGRYGFDNTLALACSACVSDTLSKSGFKFSYKEVADKNINYVLKNVIPQNSRKLSSYIKGQLSRNSLSQGGNKALVHLKKSDEVNFALFLSMSQHGSAGQKQLFESIKKVSTRPDGKVDVLDPDNGHKLWRLFSSDLNDEELSGWSRLLDNVAEEANKNGEINKKDAFYRYFKKKADADPSLADRYETLKKKNCFFN